MIKDIINIENSLMVKGEESYYDDTVRIYYCEPTHTLKRFLNEFTKNYYDDFSFEELDQVVINIDTNYNLVVSCWDYDGNEINGAMKIKTNHNIEMFELLLMSIKGV